MNPLIHPTAIIDNITRLDLSLTSFIGPNCFISAGEGRIVIGDSSGLTSNVSLFGHFGIYIGHYVMIAPNVVIATGNHNYKQTIKPMSTCLSDESLSDRGIHDGFNIYIGNDVWIGANSVITDGVKIGNGVVIGAGSIITKSINEFDIVFGNPPKVIGNRRA